LSIHFIHYKYFKNFAPKASHIFSKTYSGKLVLKSSWKVFSQNCISKILFQFFFQKFWKASGTSNLEVTCMKSKTVILRLWGVVGNYGDGRSKNLRWIIDFSPIPSLPLKLYANRRVISFSTYFLHTPSQTWIMLDFRINLQV